MPQWIDLVFLALVLVFLIALVLKDVWKFETLSMFGVDAAYFDQIVWNSLNGRLLENTIYFPGTPNSLADHFSPLLLALVPLYALHSDPRILAVTPAIAVSLSAFPIYWFAREQVGRFLALVIAIAFFLSPGIQQAGTGQFHEVILAMPLLAFAMLFLLRLRYVPFLILLGLALLCKEELPIIAMGLGIYIAFVQRKVLPGLALTLFSLSWELLLLMVVIPYFQGSTNYSYFGGSAGHEGQNLYGYLGNNLSEIVTSALLRPGLVLEHLLIGPKIDAVLILLLPLGLIPLLGADVTALAVPPLAYILLSDAPWVYTSGSWHYDPLLPFIFFGTVVGTRRIVDWIRAHSRLQTLKPARSRLARQAALGIFLLGLGFSGYPLTNQMQIPQILDPTGLVLNSHVALGMSLANRIPQNVVVLVQNELAPYVAERKRIHIDTQIPCAGMADYVFVDTKRPWYNYQKDYWAGVFGQALFEPVTQEDGYILASRKPMENALNIEFENGATLLGYTLPLTSTLQGGQVFHPIITWRADQDIYQRYVVQVRLLDGQGHLWAQSAQQPCGGNFPTDLWRKGDMIADTPAVRIPPTIPSGDYRLDLTVLDETSGDPIAMRDSSGKLVEGGLELTSLPIQKNKGSFTASELPIEQPLFVDMQEMRFLGYVPPRQTIAPGELLQVGLYWRARAKPRGDYEVAVQLRDATGRIAFEQASRPADGAYPTTEWNTGEVLLDWHDFNLPQNLAAGEYQIYAAVRDEANQRSLGETLISNISVVR